MLHHSQPTALFCFCSLCFFDMSMLNYICKSIYMVKHFLGQVVYHDYMLFQKINCSHLRGSCFECSIGNLILNTQFSISSEAVAYVTIAHTYCK